MPRKKEEKGWKPEERDFERSEWELDEVTVPLDSAQTVEQIVLSPLFEERVTLGLKRLIDLSAESGFAVLTGSSDPNTDDEMVFTRVRLGGAKPKDDTALLQMGVTADLNNLAIMTTAWNKSHNDGEGYVSAGSFHWHTYASPFSVPDLQVYDDWTENKPLYRNIGIRGSEHLVNGIFIPHTVPSPDGRRGKKTIDKVTLLMIQGPAANNIYQGRYSVHMREQQEILNDSGLTTWAIDLPVSGASIDFTPIRSALKQTPPRGKK